MKIQEAPEFFKWAAAGLICGVGLVGTHRSIGQAKLPPARPAPAYQVQGVRILGTFDTSALPSVRLTLSASNPERNARTLDAKVSLIRQEFNGSLVSRVARPNDIRKTIVEEQPLHWTVKGSDRESRTIAFRTHVPELPTSAGLTGRVTYLAVIQDGGKDVTLNFLNPFVKALR